MAFNATSQSKEADIGRYIIYRRESDDKEMIGNCPTKQLKSSETERIKLRAIDDFDPKIMTKEEKSGFVAIIQFLTLDQIQKDQRQSERQDEELNPETELTTSDNEVCTIIGEHELEKLSAMAQPTVMDKTDLQMTGQFNGYFYSETRNPCPTDCDLETDCKMRSTDSGGNCFSEDELDPYALALPFRRGDTMEAFPPTEIK